ncbi:MAG: TonB C-terminal domain-containing protein [Myxococcota bacterium]|nr:TonB C-terminal domain-containing protein [Myxococcota bacterium]
MSGALTASELTRQSERNALIGSGILHVGALLLALVFGQKEPESPPPPPPPVEVEWVALAALGEAPKPTEMTRIVQAPPPPSAGGAVSLSRERAPEAKPPPPKPRRRKRSRGKRRPPKRERQEREEVNSLDDLFRDDPRADRRPRRGRRDGHATGRSDRASESSAAALYASRVGQRIERRFKVPATISERARRGLSVKLHIRLKRRGGVAKVSGTPRWVERSGNRFFDDAALRAVKVFGPEGEGKLPLPPRNQGALREQVLRDGLQVILTGTR